MPSSSSFLTLPPPLRRGDPVRLVAASSALEEIGRLQVGLEQLRAWGLEVQQPVLAVSERRWGYLAGRDEERAADLQAVSAQQREPALWACVRGGWGSARLLERSLELPAGWLLGFSDVTSLLLERVRQGLGGGIHGPMLTTLAGEPEWSRERLRRLLFGEALDDLVGEG